MSVTGGDGIPTPDFRTYAAEPGITTASLEDRWVRVKWADGQQGRFHYIWLRDNAADAGFVDPNSREKLFDILDIPVNVAPESIEVDSDGALVLDWNGRRTRYHPGWLRAYCYDLGISDEPRRDIETWDGSMAQRLPVFDAGDISEDDDERLRWLETIRRFGIALVRGSPIDKSAYVEWLESLLLIRDMNWGKHFDVIYQADGAYISNKAVDIPPHNDAATRPQMPGIQIFHCSVNTVEGGESHWVDGFRVAEALRRDFPDDFELLTTVPWSMANRNADSEYFCRAPFIRLDAAGEPVEIRHTHWLREPLVTDFDMVEPLYAAYRRYVETANDPHYRINHRLQPGEVSFIDNPRVFHARGPYTTGEGQRHMQVSHSEREEIDSAIAVLRRRRQAAAAGTTCA